MRNLAALALLTFVSGAPLMAQYSQPVRDVENPAHAPLRIAATKSVPEGFVGTFGFSIGSPLAADRRLVIEYVSVECGTSAAVEPSRVLFQIWDKTSGGHNYPVRMSKTPTDAWTGAPMSLGSLTERLYHDGGQALGGTIYLTAAAPAGGISCRFAISGYTVTMP